MLDYNYTLNDRIFRYCVRAAGSSEQGIEKIRLIITGGAATQLFLGEEKHFLRPTDDVDLSSSRYLMKKQRVEWAKALAEKIRKSGFSCKRGLTEAGAEISISGLRDELFIRLNCFNQYYYLRNGKKIEGEFERAIATDFDGQEIKYQHPIDIIANKVDRVLSRNKILKAPINKKTSKLLGILMNGDIDGLDADRFIENLDEIAFQRQQNVEDLGRMSQQERQLIVEGYKVRKDVYDICCVVNRARKVGLHIPSSEFLDALKLALVNFSPEDKNV